MKSRGLFKSLLHHHSSKASILRRSAFFMVQLSHPHMTAGKTVALTVWTCCPLPSKPMTDPGDASKDKKIVPGEGNWCSQKTLAGLHPWVSDVCNFIAITYAFLAFHWVLYIPHFRSKPLRLHCGGVSFSFSISPFSKSDGK